MAPPGQSPKEVFSMTNRNRAWRRRKARLVFWKDQDNQRVFAHQFDDPVAKPVASLKQHRHGKLTHVQELKLTYSLEHQLVDGYDTA
jgi:hypothetical protein